MKLCYLLFLSVAWCGMNSVHSITCPQLVDAVMKFLEPLKERSEFFKSTKKSIMASTGLNLEDRQQVQTVFCAVLDSETKSIADISAQLQELYVPPINLAYGYVKLMKTLKETILSGTVLLENKREMIRFYEVTGFPNFPIKLSKTALAKFLTSFDNNILSNDFFTLADYNQETGESYLDLEKFIPLLAEATSLEDFVQKIDATYALMYEDYTKYEVERYLSNYNDTMVHDGTTEQILASYQALMGALKEAGFDQVTRGGPELYSCEFLSELAWETLGYAMDIFGDEIKQAAASELQLEFSLTDECAVKSFVCSVLKVESVAELSSLLSIADNMWYSYVTDNAMQVLLQPRYIVNQMLEELNLIRVAGRVGFPDLPLSITKGQARELASIMASYKYSEVNEEEMAEALQNAESMEDLESQLTTYSWVIWHTKEMTERYKGKEDKAITLAVNLFALGREAEKYGLLMLPD